MEIIGLFQQFGLGGIVIGALFYTNWNLVKEIKGLNEGHNARHEQRNKFHAEERDKWLEAYKENTEVLRTLAERKCPSFIAMEKKNNG